MKKVVCFILSLIFLIIMFPGCSSNEQVMFVETATGDIIRISFNPPNDMYKMYQYGDMIYFTTNDGINLMIASFSTEEHLKILLMPNTVYEKKMENLEYYDDNNYQYLLITTTDDEPQYGTIGWITGSNSAFVCASNLTKSSTVDLIKTLKFSVKSTAQEDKKHCPQFLIDKVYYPTEEEWNAIYGDETTDSTESTATTPTIEGQVEVTEPIENTEEETMDGE